MFRSRSPGYALQTSTLPGSTAVADKSRVSDSKQHVVMARNAQVPYVPKLEVGKQGISEQGMKHTTSAVGMHRDAMAVL